MAISVDASVVRWTGTPTGTTAITSASFTPANNSLLVVCVNADEDQLPAAGVTLGVSGGSLTWTQRIKRGSAEGAEGEASIWTAPVSTGASMTVAVNRTSGSSGTNRLSAKLYIVTGQHASPIGASNSAAFTADPQNLSVTTTGAGRLFGCGTDWNNATGPTSSDTADSASYTGAYGAISAYKSADHASGTSQSINFNPVAAPGGNVVVLEILAAAAAATSIVIPRRMNMGALLQF